MAPATVDPADLDGVTMGFNVDGKDRPPLTIGAVGRALGSGDRRSARRTPASTPSRAISATLVARWPWRRSRGGWFGKIRRARSVSAEGTSNVGVFGGRDGRSAGDATNVVTDYVHIRGESRSHDPAFVKEIVAAWRAAFQNAAGQVRDDRGRPAKVKFTSRLDYHSFRLKDDAPVVRRAVRAAEGAGLRRR